MNPIFLPTSQSDYSQCHAYSDHSDPWYCTALGYCMNLNYNYSKLNLMSASMANLAAIPFSNGLVLAVAQNAVDTEMVYAYPVLSKSKWPR